MPTISQIQLPSGNTYEIKDAYARQLLAGGLKFVVCWDGSSTPVVANIPAGVIVKYNGTTYTGTKSAETAEPLTFYLICSPTQEGERDVYDEYVAIGNTGSKTWEKLGDTRIDLSDLGALAYKDNVTLNKGTGDVVLGEATTFTNSSSAVSFSGGTTDKVLGSDATFSTSVSTSNTNVKATASGTAVGANGTANAITGFGTHSTDTFAKSVSADTSKKLVTASIVPTNGTETVSKVTKTSSKLVTTSIIPTNGTETVSKVTKSASKLVTTSIIPTNGTETVSKVTQTASKLVTTTVPNVTSVGSASNWSFAMGSGTDSETLIISGGNGTAPTLGTAKTVATGSVDSSGSGSAIVTGVTISDKTGILRTVFLWTEGFL